MPPKITLTQTPGVTGSAPANVSTCPARPCAAPHDVERLGQVFTPPALVTRMLALRKNSGRVLDPACGDGAFSARIADCVAIEIDPRHCPAQARNEDFFAYPEQERFATIIGNPPYVKARDIDPATAARLHSTLLDGHANLCYHFIEKCVRHLLPGGELIFITPRDFLKATGAARLNTWLFEHGSITTFDDLGDARIFKGATPNCAIWRYEKGNLTHRLDDGRRMNLCGGHLSFTRGIYTVPLASVFSVRVGAVSGADALFAHPTLGNREFVCSHSAQSGTTRRMIYLPDALPAGPLRDYLLAHKTQLLARRVTGFHEGNWWKWGRRCPPQDGPRIYVNHKTRNAQPFFRHPCNDYDGAILALFPHRRDLTGAQIDTLLDWLNAVDWEESGFVCDGRFLFSQRSLEHALLPEAFVEFAAR